MQYAQTSQSLFNLVLKILTIEDSCPRESPAIRLKKSIKAKSVVWVLADLFYHRKALTYLRYDNGSELTEKRQFGGIADGICYFKNVHKKTSLNSF